ncbi:hypothetical protein AB0J20_16350 [Micromonospora costi]|uniref:hypothetical protein n=1 Tax=Micromonospora costi TaxID=1530042 RepID=UPI00340A7CFE
MSSVDRIAASTSTDQHVDLGFGDNCVAMTVEAFGHRSAVVLTPDEADALAARLRQMANSARTIADPAA